MNSGANSSETGQGRGREEWSRDCPADVLSALVSDQVILLDDGLKIVGANRAFRSEHGPAAPEVAARSLGEVLNCRYAPGGGCGKAGACAECGLLQAIEVSRMADVGEQECRILTADGTAFDFSVRVLPLGVTGPDGAVWACGLADTFARKRLRALERAFFHDVTNLAVGIRGMFEILENAGSGEGADIRAMLQGSANKLVDEIERWRTLRVAENGDLRLWCSSLSPDGVLQMAVDRYQEETSSRHLKIVTEKNFSGCLFETDRELFMMVLGELLLNAIEASSRDDTITLGSSSGEGTVAFYVKNSAVLSPSVQAHVFERSFTTKGSGRGVGTYRAKLIAERYLKGKVWFSSCASEGTTFYVSFPLSMTNARE